MGKLGPFKKNLGGMTSPRYIRIRALTTRVLTGLTCTHNLCFEWKYEKYQSILSVNFQFLEVKFSIYLNRRVFVMTSPGGRVCKSNIRMKCKILR